MDVLFSALLSNILENVRAYFQIQTSRISVAETQLTCNKFLTFCKRIMRSQLSPSAKRKPSARVHIIHIVHINSTQNMNQLINDAFKIYPLFTKKFDNKNTRTIQKVKEKSILLVKYVSLGLHQPKTNRDYNEINILYRSSIYLRLPTPQTHIITI